MIALLGLAGSGKSTQGQKLAEVTGKTWLSVGQVLRDTGEFDSVLNSGELVDDMTVVKLMAQKMAEIVRGGGDAILDGFPRDAEQARWIADNIISAFSQVILIDVPKEELIQRLEIRGRADDTAEAIEKRFRISEENLQKICDIMSRGGATITKVDGLGTREEVFQRLLVAVGEGIREI